MENRWKNFGSIATGYCALFLIVINAMFSPEHPWALYAIAPLVWWFFSDRFIHKLGDVKYSFRVIGGFIVYYGLLNVLLAPGHPWIIYIVFVLLFWPLSLMYSVDRNHFRYSMRCTGLFMIFIMVVNLVTTPDEIWAIYPIFGVLWWPLSIYHFGGQKKRVH